MRYMRVNRLQPNRRLTAVPSALHLVRVVETTASAPSTRRLLAREPKVAERDSARAGRRDAQQCVGRLHVTVHDTA